MIAQVGDSAPDRREERGLQARAGELLRPRTTSCSTAARRVCNGRCCPRARSCPIHPVAFLVLTPQTVYGLPMSPDLAEQARSTAAHARSRSDCRPNNCRSWSSRPTPASTWSASSPHSRANRCRRATSPAGSAASTTSPPSRRRTRAGAPAPPTPRSSTCCSAARTRLHNNYQDFQAFLDAGGKIGLQHDPLLYGAYLLNPFLVRVDLVPMLVVNQGEVAVIKGFVGLPTADTSGDGVQVRFDRASRAPRHLDRTAAHRQVRDQPARVCRRDRAHLHPHAQLGRRDLGGPRPRRAAVVDRRQEPRGLRLPDRPAGADPRARHQGTEGDLDGRHDAQPRERGAAERGRQPLPQHAAGARGGASSSRPARRCRHAAFEAITGYLGQYEVETKGVYIQDVVFPHELVRRAHPARDRQPGEGDLRGAAARRDVAHRDGEGQGHRQHAVAARQRAGRRADQDQRGAGTRGRGARARPPTCSSPARQRPHARQAIGLAEAKATEALGLARATGFEAQKAALGGPATALVAVANAVADGHITVVPEVLVTGGGGSIDGLAATLIRSLRNGGDVTPNGNGRTQRRASTQPEPELVFVAEVSDSRRIRCPRRRPSPRSSRCGSRGRWSRGGQRSVTAEGPGRMTTGRL